MVWLLSEAQDGRPNFYYNDVPFVSFKLFGFYTGWRVRDAVIIYNIRSIGLMAADSALRFQNHLVNLISKMVRSWSINERIHYVHPDTSHPDTVALSGIR